jgi:ATP-binding cassette subfamily B protein
VRAIGLLWRAGKGLTVGVAVFVVAEGLVPVASMIALGRASGSIPQAIRDGLSSPAAHHLWATLTIGVCLYALSLLRGPAEDALSAQVRGRVNNMLQRRLVAAVGAPAGIAHLEDSEVLDRLSRVRGELSGYQPGDAPMTLAGKVGDRFAGLLACCVLSTYRWWLGLGLLAMWLLVRRPLRKMIAARVAAVRRSAEPLRASMYYAHLSLTPRAAAEIRIYGIGPWLVERYRELFIEGMAPTWMRIRELNIRVGLMAVLVVIGYGGAAGLLGWDAFHHRIALTTLTVMLSMLAMSVPVGVFTLADFQLGLMLSGLPDLDELEQSLASADAAGGIDEPGDANGIADVISTVPAVPVLVTERDVAEMPRREVRFESVAFRYPGAEHDVFSAVDLALPAGESTALVGVNGAGKTTLVTLLARLRDPTGGRITVDGIPLTALPARPWQRQVAVVFQDYTRYPLTVRGNIAFGLLGEAPDAEALALAADRAGAAGLIASLPNGWDTILSTGYAGGRDLSGGQWQRVALARALYAVERGARILVLDEPTAQLDVRAEAAFYDRFLEITEGVTTLLISHRFSSVRRAHSIAVLSGEGIAESGSHEELLASGGEYARMFNIQAERFTSPTGRKAAR